MCLAQGQRSDPGGLNMQPLSLELSTLPLTEPLGSYYHFGPMVVQNHPNISYPSIKSLE